MDGCQSSLQLHPGSRFIHAQQGDLSPFSFKRAKPSTPQRNADWMQSRSVGLLQRQAAHGLLNLTAPASLSFNLDGT